MSNDLSSNLLNEPSRNDLLTWINSNTKSCYNKIQQLGTGIPYCQILDTLHPINLKAKSEYEFINNFKILQQCFSKLGIYKNIEIEKLVKCKYQDNLEFLQWFHKYFEGQLGKRDSLNTSASRQQSQHRSLPRKPPSPMIPHNISKIERKGIENGSFEEVLDDLGKTNHHTTFHEQTEFFKNKIFQIQQLVDSCDPSVSSRQLVSKIREILLIQPPEALLKDITQKHDEV